MNAKNKTTSEKERWQRIRVNGGKRWGVDQVLTGAITPSEQVSDVGNGVRVRVAVCDVLSNCKNKQTKKSCTQTSLFSLPVRAAAALLWPPSPQSAFSQVQLLIYCQRAQLFSVAELRLRDRTTRLPPAGEKHA